MNFNDTVAWFLNSSTYSLYDYCFFSQIVGSADPNNLNYTTLSEFYATPAKLTQEFPIFSVERLDDDRIILTLEFTPGFLVPTSIALISEDFSGNKFLAARIVTNKGSTQINSGYERIFSIPLPYKMKGNVKEYPSFYPSIRRKSGSPSGGEKVSLGEHHHSVSLSNGSGTSYESFPDTALMTPNFIRSATNLRWVNPSSTLAMTMNERGSSNSSTVNAMGFKDSSNLISTVSRVITQTIMDSIVNYLEVLVMANNKIQILGKQIPTITSSDGYPSSEGENLYILTSDKVDPSDSRQLKAIQYSTLRKSIVGEYSTSGTAVTTNSAINYVKAGANFTLAASDKVPQIAFVVNTKAYPNNTGLISNSASTNSITVTYNGTSKISIPAQGVAIFETTTSGKYTNAISLTSFTESYLSDVMGGKLVSTALKAKTLTLVNEDTDSTFVNMTVGSDSMITITGNKE